ncbi:hypothetical protein E2C01_010892 [Portunus trituberculatus]|uniref:Uncharacterized protein n=1 Tax=Portunus trituberculatus TaxID=210409 RepID=A0A5B7D9P0_PORTR|nr:hypothetical protein [Portunus trituberculatus]
MRVRSTQLGLSKQLFSNTGTRTPRQGEKKNNLNSCRLSFAVSPAIASLCGSRPHQTTTHLPSRSHSVVALPHHNTAESSCAIPLMRHPGELPIVYVKLRQGKDAIYQRRQRLAARLLLFCLGRLDVSYLADHAESSGSEAEMLMLPNALPMTRGLGDSAWVDSSGASLKVFRGYLDLISMAPEFEVLLMYLRAKKKKKIPSVWFDKIDRNVE